MGRHIGPGRVRVKLAEMLTEKLSEQGHTVRTDPEKLWPNQGYWRCQCIKADVMAWGGQVEIYRHGKWITASVQSWETMGECTRGFDIEEESYCHFMLTAQNPLPPQKRYRGQVGRMAF